VLNAAPIGGSKCLKQSRAGAGAASLAASVSQLWDSALHRCALHASAHVCAGFAWAVGTAHHMLVRARAQVHDRPRHVPCVLCMPSALHICTRTNKQEDALGGDAGGGQHAIDQLCSTVLGARTRSLKRCTYAYHHELPVLPAPAYHLQPSQVLDSDSRLSKHTQTHRHARALRCQHMGAHVQHMDIQTRT